MDYMLNCEQVAHKYYCEHNRQKSRCKECGGGGICNHNRQRSRCKDCCGGGICKHNRDKYNCKDCGGSGICKHNRHKYNCKDCGGPGICKHNRIKSQCKECGGNSFCEHNHVRSTCMDCKGGCICAHNHVRSICKECKGGSICDHNRRKSQCKECKGINICDHNKQKSRCKQCGGSSLCKNEWCETRANRKYEGYCMPCFVNNPLNINKPAMRNYKTKEKEVVDQITQTFINFTWVYDKKIQDGCSRRRPDLLLDMGTHVIIVEIDENKHTDYDCSCENKRIMEISRDLQHRPMVIIRFNPDEYVDQNGILIKSCWRLNKLGIMQILKTKQTEWENRINILKENIQYWVHNLSNKTVEIIELFY